MFDKGFATDHPHIRPGSIQDKALVEQQSNDYLYMAAVRFINKVRFSPDLHTHSRSPASAVQDRTVRRALANSVQHIWGGELDEDQHRNVEDVPGRSIRQVSRYAALPLWVHSPM